jgi:hypothetical protein
VFKDIKFRRTPTISFKPVPGHAVPAAFSLVFDFMIYIASADGYGIPRYKPIPIFQPLKMALFSLIRGAEDPLVD